MKPGGLAHLCIDVQGMFAKPTDWYTPWLNTVLPAIEALVDRAPPRTVFHPLRAAHVGEGEIGKSVAVSADPGRHAAAIAALAELGVTAVHLHCVGRN